VSSVEELRNGHDVRMNVKVSRRDFPVLTEEIARLPKGPRRTNRLAHLATLGLLWERAVATSEAAPRQFAAPPNAGPAPSSNAAQAYQSRLDAGQLAALLDGDAEQ
jgi:hypothetical protein